jgi:hypothetical protein
MRGAAAQAAGGFFGPNTNSSTGRTAPATSYRSGGGWGREPARLTATVVR